MALPALDATFASSADLPRKQMLAKWLVEELGETQAPSNVLVSGAGSSAVNGIYTYRGDNLGKPYYNLVGEPDSTDYSAVIWNGSQWIILNVDNETYYFSSEDVEFPWLVTILETNNGESPVPTVTEIPQPSPLSNYYSLPERYLWAKIAVAAGGPKTEADYISLPKNYVWSDIYNAVAGPIPPSNVLVSGLADTQYNGLYVYDGEVDGKPSYRLNSDVSIYSSGGGNVWDINDSSVGNGIAATSSAAYPWLVTGWVDEGINPTGLVLTESPAPTPNHTDWSENVALGHIAAAYRGDTANPANLATYIDWPWRYKVASVIDHLIGNYNAVIVSGAGTTELNGTYTKRGTSNGRPYYNLIGSPDSESSNAIWWEGFEWRINSFDDGPYYVSFNNEQFPWNATGWVDSNGSLPVPTLTPTNV